jgi:hypothetical protein
LLLAALVAAVGTYALPTMLYGVLIAAAWFGVRARGTHLVRISGGHLIASTLVLGLFVVLTYLPVIVVSGADKLVANRFVVPLEAEDLLGALRGTLVRTWEFWNRDIVLPIVAVLLIGFGVASLDEARRRRVPLGLLAPAICLAMVLLQRVAPFERVWLFLLPLYLAIASVGVVKLGPGRWSNLVAWLACVVALQLAIAALISGSILRSPETGTFADAEAVARSLRGRLASGDAVLTTLPASLPELQYYFPKVGLPIDALVRSPEEAQHLYVVAAPDSIPTVPGWGQPEEIARYPGSVLLLLYPG